MFAPIMRAVCGTAPPSGPAQLADYARYGVIGEIYPALVALAGAHVDGIVYDGIAATTWRALDAFEGELYTRQAVMVTIAANTTVTAWTYVLAPTQHALLSDTLWRPAEFASRHLARYLAGLAHSEP